MDVRLTDQRRKQDRWVLEEVQWEQRLDRDLGLEHDEADQDHTATHKHRDDVVGIPGLQRWFSAKAMGRALAPTHRVAVVDEREREEKAGPPGAESAYISMIVRVAIFFRTYANSSSPIASNSSNWRQTRCTTPALSLSARTVSS